MSQSFWSIRRMLSAVSAGTCHNEGQVPKARDAHRPAVGPHCPATAQPLRSPLPVPADYWVSLLVGGVTQHPQPDLAWWLSLLDQAKWPLVGWVGDYRCLLSVVVVDASRLSAVLPFSSWPLGLQACRSVAVGADLSSKTFMDKTKKYQSAVKSIVGYEIQTLDPEFSRSICRHRLLQVYL